MEVTGSATRAQVAGKPAESMAELSALLPVEAISADIAGLIPGPPDARRRMLDWGVFHVEHSYLDAWRQFRRALVQRNAALRGEEDADLLQTWEKELAVAAERVDQHRQAYVRELHGRLDYWAARLLDQHVHFRYLRGWSGEIGYLEQLAAHRESDREAGYTRMGPHRADCSFEIDDLASRTRASRGQQKLLGIAWILAQCNLVMARTGHPVVLLIDEPAADLDHGHLERFMVALDEIQAQVLVATISTERLRLPDRAVMFHVEHGHANALL
jgi:DNA replication and repair protein RecF